MESVGKSAALAEPARVPPAPPPPAPRLLPAVKVHVKNERNPAVWVPGSPGSGSWRPSRAAQGRWWFWGHIFKKSFFHHFPGGLEGWLLENGSTLYRVLLKNIFIYKPPVCSCSRTVCPAHQGLKSTRQESQMNGKKL